MWVLFVLILACGLLGFVISSFLVYDPRSYNQTIREEIGETNSEDETCELYDPKIIQNHKMA
jgi:hypothetical protein